MTKFYIGLQILFTILILIYSIKLEQSAHETSLDYNYMMKNWDTDFIEDIYKSSPDGKCNAGD